MEKINVTKTYLPPLTDYITYLERIWSNGQVTNQGELLEQFEKRIAAYLRVPKLQLVSNGTMALQLGIRALNITDGEIITTPFSYVATTSAILWERCVPVYVDISPRDLCIDTAKIEAAITRRTVAILAVHVFGNPCNIQEIQRIAAKHKLKVIYDAAHAFGVTYQDKSIMSYGDISTCSFHATKLFHTIEGGGIVASDKKVSQNIELSKRFGHTGDEHYIMGINAKATEFQAAMGLCNLKYIDNLIAQRKIICERYNELLAGYVEFPEVRKNSRRNYGYYPIILKSEEQMISVKQSLESRNIYPRRYFFPSLNTLPYLDSYQSCPVSEDIASRILCLPMYPDLSEAVVSEIVARIKRVL